MILTPPSLRGPSNWDLPPFAGALYTPTYSFQTALPVNLQIFLALYNNNKALIQFMVCSYW
jgi:hypothetical protein